MGGHVYIGGNMHATQKTERKKHGRMGDLLSCRPAGRGAGTTLGHARAKDTRSLTSECLPGFACGLILGDRAVEIVSQRAHSRPRAA